MCELSFLALTNVIMKTKYRSRFTVDYGLVISL